LDEDNYTVHSFRYNSREMTRLSTNTDPPYRIPNSNYTDKHSLLMSH